MQDTITRLRAKEGDEGFTLIELLVVVVIIGVLVAIAVPVYLNYRKGAADKSAQSDVRGAISAVEQYYTDNSNAYPSPVPGLIDQTAPITIGSQKITLSDKTHLTLYVAAAGASTYKICAYNSGGTTNKNYVYDSANGGSVASVTSPSAAYMTACA